MSNLPASQLFDLLDADFQRAWDAMAATDSKEALREADPHAGGNFMFARQAMGLVELASRVASSEPTGGLLRDFSRELATINACYFTRLPGRVPLPSDFCLPFSPNVPKEEQLLPALFDMIRHGQAHQYQQIPVALSDGMTFMVSLTGVEQRRPLRVVRDEQAKQKQRHHLSLIPLSNRVALLVRPEYLYLDFRDAARRASLFGGGIDLEYLQRPRKLSDRNYRFTGADLECALRDGGHPVRGVPTGLADARPES